MNAPAAIRTAWGAVLLWSGFFAGWTLGSVPLTLACAPFRALWLPFLLGLVGAGAAMRFLGRPLGDVLLAPAALPAGPLRLPEGVDRLMTGVGTLAILAAAVFFIPTSNALPLWILVIVCGAAALLVRGGAPGPTQPGSPAGAFSSWVALLLLVTCVCALYLLLLRPDADDAFYLNLPVGLLTAEECMMAADTMYGADDWPLLGSNYRAEALPTLIAAVAYASDLPVITVAHLTLPLLWCVVWVGVLAVIGHGLFGDRWWIFAGLAVLASMVFAGTLLTWGVHGIARMFHGKAPLVLVVFPLIAYLTLRVEAARFDFARSFAALFGLCAIALGLTANAIYLAPLVLGLSLLAARLASPGAPISRLALILAGTAPLLAGLWLFLFDRPVSADPADGWRFSTDLGVWNLVGGKLTLGLLVLALAMATWAARAGQIGRWTTAYLVVFFAFAINPLLWPFFDRFVTGGLTSRMWWALPLPTLLAAFLTWGILRSGRPRSATLVCGLGLAALSILPTGLIGNEYTEVRASIHKVPPDVVPVARSVLAAAPQDGTVLAPNDISAWLPIRVGHPALVYVRRLYFAHNAQVVEAERLEPRRLLARWISGMDAPAVDDVLAALVELRVRIIVLPTASVPAGASEVLDALRAEALETVSGYTLYEIPGQTLDPLADADLR